MVNPPTLAGFLVFLRRVVGISPLDLPDDEPAIPLAFELAREQVNTQLAFAGRHVYALAVYNLGADRVINFAPDQEHRTYFVKLRETLGVNVFLPGVIGSSGNAGASESLVSPEFTKNLSMMDLQNLKTYYGRQYLAYARSVGSNWGVS